MYEYLSATAGFLSPLVEGMIVDEFGGSEPVLPNYGDALRKLRMTPEFKDKFMYVYCYGLLGLPGGTGQRLLDALAMTGSAMAWERYLKTQSNESTARAYLRETMVQRAHEYRAGPSYMQYMAVCIGYFTKAGGHLLNATPSVDYKTYLDMQFNIVANDPVFWGTYGLMGYHSNYSDEETLRWMCKLFRHYGIEGNSEPATDDPYQPGHIQNSDFITDTDGWTLNPADEGSIRRGFRRGWGSLQTRYGSIEGDTFLVTVRNASRPNAFSQEIKNLEPGRLYSFRMYRRSCGYVQRGKGCHTHPDRERDLASREIRHVCAFQSRARMLYALRQGRLCLDELSLARVSCERPFGKAGDLGLDR